MTAPAHRQTKPRVSVVVIPRTAYIGILWLLLCHLIDGLHDWTGWWMLKPFSSWALLIALGYLVVAAVQRSRRAQRR
jgi:hypothetical protein